MTCFKPQGVLGHLRLGSILQRLDDLVLRHRRMHVADLREARVL